MTKRRKLFYKISFLLTLYADCLGVILQEQRFSPKNFTENKIKKQRNALRGVEFIISRKLTAEKKLSTAQVSKRCVWGEPALKARLGEDEFS